MRTQRSAEKDAFHYLVASHRMILRSFGRRTSTAYMSRAQDGLHKFRTLCADLEALDGADATNEPEPDPLLHNPASPRPHLPPLSSPPVTQPLRTVLSIEDLRVPLSFIYLLPFARRNRLRLTRHPILPLRARITDERRLYLASRSPTRSC
ncbi:hypothetical protein AAT19DRAFT_11422 [Rhodotorula toruloides]|uniref:Uncharacterized protein n=1 Tax=Rhodotorula toruloides TaxID=5286 RepID=A0A2S9ZWQ7_RHOTO|nr:hypothetical protein AAT19DRAFT_11422 [Rhodotorula toruloides]